ncbi:MAG: hypothetical protein JXQ96_13895 [Cyclobacteriaceae bacterium]
MKKILTLLIVLLFVSKVCAQDDFDTRWNETYELVKAKKYTEALEAYQPLLVEQPTNVNTHIQVSWCYLLGEDFENAAEHALTAYDIDKLYFGSNLILAYVMYAVDQKETGKILLDASVWLTDDESIKGFKSDITEMEDGGLDVTTLTSDYNNVINNLEGRNKSWEAIAGDFTEGVEKLNGSDVEGARESFKKTLQGFGAAPEAQQVLGFHAAYTIGTYFYTVNDSTGYLPVLRRAIEFLAENNKTSVVPIIHTITLLGEHYYLTGQYEQSFKVLSRGLEFLTKINQKKYLSSYGAMFLSQYSQSANAVGNMKEARDAATMVTEIAMTGYDQWYQANAWIYLAQAWSEDSSKEKEYYQNAYNLADQSGFEELKASVAEKLK